MGLDIYTYTAEQHHKSSTFSAAEDAVYEEYSYLYDEDYDAFKEKLDAATEGLEDATYTDVPSKKYPEHLFNRRYLRSSYNESGFDRAVPVFTGNPQNTLEGIFAGAPWLTDDPETSEYPGGTLDRSAIPFLTETVIPRAQAVVEALRESDSLTATFVGPNMFIDINTYPSSTEAAVESARNVLDRSTSSFRSFSSREGTFFTEGLEIIAAIPGRSFFGQAGTYLVFKSSQESKDSYIQSAEIVVEFVEELIDLINKDGSVYVSWSG